MCTTTNLFISCVTAALPILIEKYDQEPGDENVVEQYHGIAQRAILAAAQVANMVDEKGLLKE